VTDDIDRHGVFSPSRLLQTDRVRDLMFDRALNMLTQHSAFTLFPLGMRGERLNYRPAPEI
jgi:hypothetical protein